MRKDIRTLCSSTCGVRVNSSVGSALKIPAVKITRTTPNPIPINAPTTAEPSP